MTKLRMSMSKIVVKRLSDSDLTLFTCIKKRNIHQKAIHLNENVFIKKLYPKLDENATFELNLSIYGPGQAGIHELVTKIIKQSKDWRLGGSTIDNPVEEPERYKCLERHDYAIIMFDGITGPTKLEMTLVCASLEKDKPLYAALKKMMVKRSMADISSIELAELLANAATSIDLALARTCDRMAKTALSTAAQSNGQKVVRTIKNKELDLTQDELRVLLAKFYSAQKGLCALTNIPLRLDCGDVDHPFLCSLDRINSDGNYSQDNVQIVCKFANRWKSDSDNEEFKRLVDTIRKQWLSPCIGTTP